MELAFMAESRGEAPMAGHKGTEVPMAKRQPEDPALTVRQNGAFLRAVCADLRDESGN